MVPQHLPSMQPQFKMQWFWVSSPLSLAPLYFPSLASPWGAFLEQSLQAVVTAPSMDTLSLHLDQVINKRLSPSMIYRIIHGWHSCLPADQERIHMRSLREEMELNLWRRSLRLSGKGRRNTKMTTNVNGWRTFPSLEETSISVVGKPK